MNTRIGARATAVLLAALVAIVLGPIGGASAVVGPTDLTLTKSDSADPVTVGDNFTYTVQVNNTGAGANDAADVVVTDTLPSRVSFVSATASSGTCQRTGSTVNCSLGQVNAGTNATATIVVKASKSGTASNTASVTTSSGDPDAADNQETETTLINKKLKPKKQKPSCATPTIIGTDGDDTLVGTNRADVIRGFAGNDQVFAGGGKDLICADFGADLVSGGTNGDTVIGGGGPDTLFGNFGGDLLKGKGGRDRLRGNFGNDILNGGRKRDSCKGGAGRDALRRCP